MLRVSSGKYKRAPIPLAPQHRQHRNATTARVKEAAFQLIRNRIDITAEWIFYDLFAGSGQMGIEALSLGAVHSTFVDIVPERLSEIQRALTALDIPREAFTLARTKAAKLLPEAFAHRNLPCVIWADPPYTYAGAASNDPAMLIALYRTALAENPQLSCRPLLMIQVHEKNPVLAHEFLAANPDLEVYRYGSNCLLLLA
jgi:16S rRNA (guanine(966)-N(2))-methyltransferase RsmD